MNSKKNIFLWIFLTLLFILLLSSSLVAQKEVPITTTSKEAHELILKARDLIENVDFEGADVLIDKAIELDNTFAIAYMLKIYNTPDADGKNEHMKNAILYSGYASKGEQMQIEIMKNYLNNNISKARMIEDALIQMFPEDPRPLYYKGINLYSTGEEEKALTVIKKVIEMKPDYPPAHNILGYLYMGMGDYDNAKKEIQKYIALMPDNPNPYDSYGELLLKTGDYDESIKNFNIAYEKGPTFKRALYMIGNGYLFKGDYNTAREYYRKFADESNNINSMMLAKRLKSFSYLYENNVEEALKNFVQYRDFAESQKNSLEVAKSYQYEGLVLCENGRTAEALEKYDEYSKRIGKLPLSWQEKASLNAYSSLDLAYAYAMNNELVEAKDKLEQAENEVEKDNDVELKDKYNFTKGLIDFKEGNYNSAISNMNKMINPNCLQNYYHAEAYRKIGDNKSADDLCKKIKNLNESHLVSGVVWNKVK